MKWPLGKNDVTFLNIHFAREWGIKTALFLQVLIDTGKSKNISITEKEIEELTTLTRDEQRTVRKHCEELGIIVMSRVGFPAQIQYALDFKMLDMALPEKPRMLTFSINESPVVGNYTTGQDVSNPVSGNYTTGDSSNSNIIKDNITHAHTLDANNNSNNQDSLKEEKKERKENDRGVNRLLPKNVVKKHKTITNVRSIVNTELPETIRNKMMIFFEIVKKKKGSINEFQAREFINDLKARYPNLDESPENALWYLGEITKRGWAGFYDVVGGKEKKIPEKDQLSKEDLDLIDKTY